MARGGEKAVATTRLDLATVRARLLPPKAKQPAPPSRDPWLLILRENVAYLADDAKRAAAFALLSSSVGTKPQAIAAASDAKLLAVTRHGILAETFAAKLRDCARLAIELFPPRGDFAPLKSLQPAKAAKQLAKFPGIGAPGVERLLLFSGLAPRTLAPESNALRVLVRLGFTREEKNYAATWRAARDAVAPELDDNAKANAALHLALRRHGQEVCTSSKPKCGTCVLKKECPSAEA